MLLTNYFLSFFNKKKNVDYTSQGNTTRGYGWCEVVWYNVGKVMCMCELLWYGVGSFLKMNFTKEGKVYI